MIRATISCSLAIILLLTVPLRSQTTPESLLEQKKFTEALSVINAELDTFYSSRMAETRIPENFITLAESREKADLLEMFRNRREKGFFIEENNRVADLHILAARCHEGIGEYRPAVNHCYQSLRFRIITRGRDDAVFALMASLFSRMKETIATINCLEAAAPLAPDKYEYSLELAEILYRRNDPKRAIYHYENYLSRTRESADPDIYLKLGNLYEITGRYLETERYYSLYLEKKPDNPAIFYALGVIAFRHTGNHPLAFSSFGRALDLLPPDDILRQARCREYMGDMYRSDREYALAVENYRQSILFEKKIREDLDAMRSELAEMETRISNIKKGLLKKPSFDDYEELQILQNNKAKKEMLFKTRESDLEKLHPGVVRWNLAECLELLERLPEALDAYRDCVEAGYRAYEARERIKKIRLKITRGY